MRAVVSTFITPDAESPDAFVPPPGNDAWVMLIQAMIGPDDGLGEESFQIQVCTPAWLAARLEAGDPPLPGAGYLIAANYDWPLIERTLRRHVSYLSAPTWNELALKLSRLGYWEFQDDVE